MPCYGFWNTVHNNLICPRNKSVGGHHEWGIAVTQYDSRGKPGASEVNMDKIIPKEKMRPIQDKLKTNLSFWLPDNLHLQFSLGKQKISQAPFSFLLLTWSLVFLGSLKKRLNDVAINTQLNYKLISSYSLKHFPNTEMGRSQ